MESFDRQHSLVTLREEIFAEEIFAEFNLADLGAIREIKFRETRQNNSSAKLNSVKHAKMAHPRN